jgi:hypothetical protein
MILLACQFFRVIYKPRAAVVSREEIPPGDGWTPPDFKT